MSRLSSLLLTALGVTALSACAPMTGGEGAKPSPNRQCFYPDQVDNFRGNNQTIYVRARNKDVFELQTFGMCSDVDFAFAIAFVPNTALSRLCVGDTSRLVVGAPPRDLCRVQVVKQLTEAEVMALPSRDRP
ncbi:DUF6491 family protein [Brevundimonas sp. NPDC090276]|uniref:DUF6491 family protein n=1 Tax=Brevundimonas sp. NPDC090276 TaxID=3363956 RepID=UPI00383BD8F9